MVWTHSIFTLIDILLRRFQKTTKNIFKRLLKVFKNNFNYKYILKNQFLAYVFMATH